MAAKRKSSVPIRTGPQTPESLRQLAVDLRALADGLDEVAGVLSSGSGRAVQVLYSRGVSKDRGALWTLEQFLADARRKAYLAAADAARRKR